MRNLDLRKQLKSFGKGLLRGAAAGATAGASEGGRIGEKIYETYQSYNKKPKVGNLPSMVEVAPTTKKKATGIKNTSKKLKSAKATGIKAISKKLKGVKATGAKMQYAKKLEKLPATSTNAKQAGVKSVKTKTPSPEITKAKHTVKKTASNKKVKTKVKTNKRGSVKIKTKISPVKLLDPKDPKDPKKTYGKVTVKKEKKGNTTTVTATRPFSTSGGKKTYKQFEKEGGDVVAAKKFNKGKETKSITVVNKKSKGVKAIPIKSPKPKIDLSKKPKKPSNVTVGPIVPGKKKKQPKITKAKVKGNRRPSGLGRVKGCN